MGAEISLDIPTFQDHSSLYIVSALVALGKQVLSALYDVFLLNQAF